MSDTTDVPAPAPGTAGWQQPAPCLDALGQEKTVPVFVLIGRPHPIVARVPSGSL